MIKDVMDYFDKLSSQYNKMLEMAKLAEKDYKCDNMSEEMFNRFCEQLKVIKTNYSRMAYIVFLLNQPKKKKKPKKDKQHTKDLFSMLNADDTSVINENESALSEMKNTLPKKDVSE